MPVFDKTSFYVKQNKCIVFFSVLVFKCCGSIGERNTTRWDALHLRQRSWKEVLFFVVLVYVSVCLFVYLLIC